MNYGGGGGYLIFDLSISMPPTMITILLLSDAAVDWTIGLRPREISTSTLTLSSSSLSCVVVICEGTVT